ncbi:MAG: hypothetical protein R3245_00025 [Kiloniellales bacterium]|nr:hypothetical protein [Kiloniellales bacterium]
MRIKSFTADNSSLAMALVREAFGEDAIILATQDEPDGTVTITAAAEPRIHAKREADHERDLPDAPLPANAMHEAAFGGVRKSLDERSPSKKHSRASARNLHLIARVLDFHGFPQASVKQLLDLAAAEPVLRPSESLGTALSQHFRLRPASFFQSEKPVMLVGMPGVGKTSAAAKIAVATRLQERPIHFINLDVAKTGAGARLQSFADAIGAGLDQAKCARELRSALRNDKALTIIDTPGVNPFHDEEMAFLKEIAAECGAELLQVMAAGLDRDEACEIADAFSAIGAKSSIVTRIDTARRIGAPLAALRAAELTLVALSESAEISSGFAELSARSLARRLLAPLHPSSHNRFKMEVA